MTTKPSSSHEASFFLAFEGPEGAGKSTQIQHLARRIEAEGYTVRMTREPGGTATGDRIRDILLNTNLDITPMSEFLLYAAARAQHVEEVIAPTLRQGTIVLCDRYAASSVAYQGYGRGLDPSWVASVNDAATQGFMPDCTLLLDLPPEQGLARVANRGAADRLERADLAFHTRVREGFLTLARHDARWTVLDATTGVDTLASQVWDVVRPRLPQVENSLP